MTYRVGGLWGRLGLSRTANIKAYYQFDGDITDSGPGGLDLTKVQGTEQYTQVAPGIIGAHFDLATSYKEGTGAAALQITGALTIHMLIRWDDAPESNAFMVAHLSDSVSGAEADNALYVLGIDSTTNRYRYYHEQGAGTNEDTNGAADFDDFVATYGVPHLWTLTRDTAGTDVQVYIDGKPFMSFAPSTAPTGGGNGWLKIGAWKSASLRFRGALAEVQILNTELTAAQVLVDAQRVMPV